MGQKARVDLVLDCAEPKKLADFWRDALNSIAGLVRIRMNVMRGLYK